MQIASLRLFAAQEIGVVQSACVISALNSLLPSSGQRTVQAPTGYCLRYSRLPAPWRLPLRCPH